MDNVIRTISDLESEIQYLKKLLDDNGISYDYEAHLRALQSDVGDIIFPELGPEHAVCCIRILRDEGMFMHCVQIKGKDTTASVIMRGLMVYALKRMGSR